MKKEFTFEEKKYYIKSASHNVNQKASRLYAIEFTKGLQDGLMSKEEMSEFLEKRKVFTKEDKDKEEKLVEKINNLERELYRGGPDRKKISLQEGKKMAYDIKQYRIDYMQHMAEKQRFEASTAEALADNARFDFLVSECTFTEDGTRVYNNIEDYNARADEDLSFTAASTLAQMLYDMDDDFSKRLPENQFLLKFGLVDDELRLVDKNGNLVDMDNRRINEEGHYLDENGNRVDKFGSPLTKDGFFELDVTYVDDDGNTVNPKDEEKPDESDDQETDDDEEKVEEPPKKQTRRRTAKSSG